MSSKRRYTPEIITTLGKGEVFVFGSNLNGNHAGGAARAAVENFGAVFGQAEGLQGHSYAIPTLGREMERLPLSAIGESIDKLIEFAKANGELTFYMTKIGCGIAGFGIESIAALFREREVPENIILPREFT